MTVNNNKIPEECVKIKKWSDSLPTAKNSYLKFLFGEKLEGVTCKLKMTVGDQMLTLLTNGDKHLISLGSFSVKSKSADPVEAMKTWCQFWRLSEEKTKKLIDLVQNHINRL